MYIYINIINIRTRNLIFSQPFILYTRRSRETTNVSSYNCGRCEYGELVLASNINVPTPMKNLYHYCGRRCDIVSHLVQYRLSSQIVLQNRRKGVKKCIQNMYFPLDYTIVLNSEKISNFKKSAWKFEKLSKLHLKIIILFKFRLQLLSMQIAYLFDTENGFIFRHLRAR